MTISNFDPKVFRGKKQIFIKVATYQGICNIFDWNLAKLRYEKRTTGLKYYAYKKVAGVQRSKTFENFDDARKWRDSPGFFVENNFEAFTFREVKDRFFEHQKRKVDVSTLETYQSVSRHLWFFDSLLMRDVTPKAVDAWLVELKKPEYLETQHRTRLTYHQELKVLRLICLFYSEYLDDSYQVPCKKRHNEDSIIDHQRYRQKKSEQSQRFIPKADIESFLAVSAQLGSSDPTKLVYSILAHLQLRTGLRIGEACAIRFEDLDWKSGALLVAKSVQWKRRPGTSTRISPLTKTGEQRIVYVPSDALSALKSWRDKCHWIKGLVFSENGLEPLSYRSVQHQYNAFFRASRLKWTSTHIMRHSFSTDFLTQTGDRNALRAQLGHRTSSMTDLYAKITSDVVQRGMQRFDEKNGSRLSLVKNGPNFSEGLGEAGNLDSNSQIH